jgi:hypothetical protein
MQKQKQTRNRETKQFSQQRTIEHRRECATRWSNRTRKRALTHSNQPKVLMHSKPTDSADVLQPKVLMHSKPTDSAITRRTPTNRKCRAVQPTKSADALQTNRQCHHPSHSNQPKVPSCRTNQKCRCTPNQSTAPTHFNQPMTNRLRRRTPSSRRCTAKHPTAPPHRKRTDSAVTHQPTAQPDCRCTPTNRQRRRAANQPEVPIRSKPTKSAVALQTNQQLADALRTA